MPNIKVTLSYDGTNFYGFQIQPNKRTVQGEFEKALLALFNEKIKVVGCSRTDTGVHALNYVLNFNLKKNIPPSNIYRMLNDYFNENKIKHCYSIGEIYIKKINIAREDFHARYDAKQKTYLYKIAIEKNVFNKNYALTIDNKINLKKMRDCSKYLLGKHDFSSFKTNTRDSKTGTVRTIKKITISQKDGFIEIRITGDGFLYNMVRIIVGTLIEITLSEKKPSEVKKILSDKNRASAGFTAPACGLYLEKIVY